LGFLTGKPAKSTSSSTQTSSSGNYAYQPLAGSLLPTVNNVQGASSAMAALLGIPQTGSASAPIPTGGGIPAGGGVPTGGGSVLTGGQGSPSGTLNGGGSGTIGLQNGNEDSILAHINSLRASRGLGPLGSGTAASTSTAAAAPAPTTAQSQTDALSNFANSGGYQYLLNQGINGINADRSAKGLLQSGSTATGVTRMANGLAQTYLNQYMNNLQNYGQLGLGSAGVLASAGQHSEGTGTSTGTSKGAKQGLLGDVAQGVGAYFGAGGSDIRMKMNIEHIGEYKNGLNKYLFEYKDRPGVKVIGAMAHEVKEIMPEAYIENFKDGYAGVDYSYFKGL
jgi:hypothetical protein